MVRALTLDDRHALTALVKDSLQGDFTRGHWTEAEVLDSLAQAQVMGYFVNHELAAGLVYQDISGDKEVLFVLTATAHRRKGLAETLLRTLIQSIAENHEIWLEVHAQNAPAIQFYQKLGFIRTGVRKAYYRDGGDALLFLYKRLHSA